jgi:DNA-binding transcriptional regulator YdaS (Cro superfamily)
MAKPRAQRKIINTPLYQRMIYVDQYAKTNKEAAARLGISERSLRRWKRDGISNRASQSPKYTSKINRVAAGIVSSQQRLPTEQRRELRPVWYYHRQYYTDARSKIYKTAGATYEQLLEIVLRECYRGGYTGFSFELKFNAPFEGFMSMDNSIMSYAQYQALPKRQQKEVRDLMCFIQVNMDKPFFRSHKIALIPDDCHPDNFTTTLDNFFHMPNVDITNIKFDEPRDPASWFGEGEDDNE